MNDRDALEAVRRASIGFSHAQEAIRPLLDLIGAAKLVLIGEATHGTDEFYRLRAALTAALIREKRLNLIVVEAGWRDAYRVNRWVRHSAQEPDGASRATARQCGYAGAVVWAHNSHVGDARATQMGWWNEVSLGQLARERLAGSVFIVGFTTHGTVTVAREWDLPAERRAITPSLAGSYERLFHSSGATQSVLPAPDIRNAFETEYLERAIGVVYKPETERASHYFRASLAEQFDGVVHIDHTSALVPLEPWPREGADLPETHPTGV
jgi:erythromycin esterase-like protein